MSGEQEAQQLSFVPTYIQANSFTFYNTRVFTAIVAGCVAGVLGLTNALGLLSYLLAMAVTSAAVALKLGGDVTTYFVNWKSFCLDGVFDAVMTYLLFWTLVYNLVHLFE